MLITFKLMVRFKQFVVYRSVLIYTIIIIFRSKSHLNIYKIKQEKKLTSASRSLYTLAVIIIKFKNTKILYSQQYKTICQ